MITGLHTVGIPATDQDRALAFSLALEPAHAERPAGVETGIRFSTTDADATHAELRARDVDVDDVLRWPGVPAMFAFRDQDGNGLEIVEA
jgi:lactoylglutathione lyase